MNITLTSDAAKQFDKLPLSIKARVQKIFVRLAAWPNVSGAKPLRHELAGKFRIRTGDYRVQFYVIETESTLVIERIGHRDGFYDGQ